MGKQDCALVLVLASLFVSGCAEPSALRANPGKVTLQPVTYTQWQERLAGYRGNVVVVDVWATWCSPCVQRFPHMVGLSRKYSGRQGIRFVSMSLDDRSDPAALELAHKFLIQQNATMDNYRMDEIVPDALDKLGIQGIPAVLLYDRQGNLRYRLTGDNPNHQFTNEDVDRAVQQMLSAAEIK